MILCSLWFFLYAFSVILLSFVVNHKFCFICSYMRRKMQNEVWYFTKQFLFVTNLRLTLCQMTKFRLFQTEKVSRRLQNWWKWWKVPPKSRKCCGKGEIAVMSNFFFSYRVFKRLVLQTYANCLGKSDTIFDMILGKGESDDNQQFLLLTLYHTLNF